MNQKISNEQEFEDLIKALGKDLWNAGHYNRLHENITNAVHKEKSGANQSPSFWGLTLDAYHDSCLLHLCRAYDTENSSLSLKQFLEIIKKHPELFNPDNFQERLKNNPHLDSLQRIPRQPTEEQLEKDLAYVTSSKNHKVLKLIQFRGHTLAHTGLKKTIKGIDNQTLLTWGEVDELSKKGLEIFNRYLYLYESATYYPELMGEKDFQYVLDSIKIRQITQRYLNEINQIKYSDTYSPEIIVTKINQLQQDINSILYPN